MAIQLLGADGLTLASVDPTHRAQRASIRPQECVSWASLGVMTGAVVGLAAGSVLFALRNNGARQILLRRLQVAWITQVLGAAGRLDFGAVIQRSYTVMDSAGTAIAVAGKHRVAFNAPSVDCRVATTAAVSGGTRTADPHAVAVAGLWSAAIGSGLATTQLISHDAGDHPIAFNQQEGITINCLASPSATLAGVLYVNAELVEADYP